MAWNTLPNDHLPDKTEVDGGVTAGDLVLTGNSTSVGAHSLMTKSEFDNYIICTGVSGTSCMTKSEMLAVAIVLPAAPSGLTATAISSSQIDLTWTDNSSNETGFKVYRCTDGINYTYLDTTGSASYSNTSLDPSTTYYYTVTAYNGAGESDQSAADSATTDAVAPAAPTDLVATAINANRIDLSWTDNATNETGYYVYRSTNGTNYNLLETIGSDSTAYQNTSLDENTTYWYKVSAYNGAGESALAGPASDTTPQTVPNAPNNLSATATSTTTAHLAWSDNATNESGFEIWRSSNGGSSYSLFDTINSANTTEYDASGLTAEATYFWKVLAFNTAGSSALSGAASATQPPNAPAAPSGLTATTIDHQQIDLAWTDNSNNETGFYIYRNVSGGSYSLYQTVGANTTEYSATGLSGNTLYGFYVVAYNAGGNSSASNTDTATTDPTPTAPTISPDSFSGVDSSYISNNVGVPRVTLSWSNPSGASTSWTVRIFRDNVLDDTTLATPVPGSQNVDLLVPSFTTYTFYIDYSHAGGDGPNTSSIQVETVDPNA